MPATSADEARAAWGAQIRRARRDQGLTQAELATKASTDQPTVSDAENGRCGLTIYARLARVLGVTLTLGDVGQAS